MDSSFEKYKSRYVFFSSFPGNIMLKELTPPHCGVGQILYLLLLIYLLKDVL